MRSLHLLTDDVLQEKIYGARVGDLKVFVFPKTGFRRKYAEAFVRYGSNDNAFVPPGEFGSVNLPPGIAHFMEHKMFEKSWGEAFSAFARLGASANAYTSNNYTSYLFWTLDNFEKSLELLMDVVFAPYFTSESVAKEQGIIGQEIRMYQDDPGSRLFRETMEAMYMVHPVRFDVAGSEESISKISADLLNLCHKSFYKPANVSLFLAGDLEPEHALRVAERAITSVGRRVDAAFSKGSDQPPARIRPQEPLRVSEDREVCLPVPTPLVQVSWKLEPPGNAGDLIVTREIALSILLNTLFGKSSEFFTKVYEDGIVDDLSIVQEVWPDYAFAGIVAQSSSPEEFSQKVRAEIEEAGQGKKRQCLEEDFERNKKAVMGRYITLFDSFGAVGEMQVHLDDIGLHIFTYADILKNLGFDAILGNLHLFKADQSVRVIVKK